MNRLADDTAIARALKSREDMPSCNDTRSCWARNGDRCTILNHAYEADGACPFCKPKKERKSR